MDQAQKPIAGGIAAKEKRRRSVVLLGCWLVGGTLLLSLAHSKLVTYLWPVFPAVAILAAVAWMRLWEGTLTAWARRLMGRTLWTMCLTGPAALPAAMIAQQRLGPWRLPPGLWVPTMLVAAACWMPLVFWLRGRLRATLASSLAVVALHFAFIMTVVMPHLADEISARDLADYFNRRGQLPPQVLLAEERIGSLVFYLDGPLRASLRGGQLQSVALDEIFDPRLAGPQGVVALDEGQLAGTAAQAARLADMPFERAGHWRVYRTADLAAWRSSAARGNELCREGC